MSANGTYPTSSSAISSYLCHRIISLRTWLFCLASTSSLTNAAAVVETNAPFLPASCQTQASGQVSFPCAAFADKNNRFLALDIAAFG